MKLPISIIEKNGEVTVYASVHEAEIEMEPIDVECGEYVVTDSDGNLLQVKVVVQEVSVLFGLWKSQIKKVRIFD